ncbi:MAG: cytidylate kinase-like family protein [Spirochaetes bacterium]|nr:cytidylate kinase-like family protein [Spirochaetota bacterium]
MSIVTIRGTLGSGAPEIGRLIAQKIHGDYVDREIIERVAKTIDKNKKYVIDKEMPDSSVFGRIIEALAKSPPAPALDGLYAAYLPTWEYPLDDNRYLAGLETVIKQLAEHKSIVIRGRGSQFILKDKPGAFHVLTVASTEIRTKRVMEEKKTDESGALKLISRFDNSRREFIKRYFNADLDDPVHYDLVINTDRMTFEHAASLVSNALSLVRDAM